MVDVSCGAMVLLCDRRQSVTVGRTLNGAIDTLLDPCNSGQALATVAKSLTLGVFPTLFASFLELYRVSRPATLSSSSSQIFF